MWASIFLVLFFGLVIYTSVSITSKAFNLNRRIGISLIICFLLKTEWISRTSKVRCTVDFARIPEQMAQLQSMLIWAARMSGCVARPKVGSIRTANILTTIRHFGFYLFIYLLFIYLFIKKNCYKMLRRNDTMMFLWKKSVCHLIIIIIKLVGLSSLSKFYNCIIQYFPARLLIVGCIRQRIMRGSYPVINFED